MEAFQKALESDPDFAEAHKGIGLISFKKGENSTAVTHLNRYVELKPEAQDRAYIEQYLKQIENDGGGQ